MQNHYPESMLKVYVVNAPRLFAVTWKLLTPLIDPVTVAKFSFHGSVASDKETQRVLLEAGVDRDFLHAKANKRG